MLRFVLCFGVLSLLAAAPALAQPVSPENDRLLWCSSAFYLLAGTAYDSGEDDEGAQYDQWSETLLEAASVSLVQSGMKPQSVENLIEEYTNATREQLKSLNPPYDVTTCPELLGPEASP